MYYVNILQLLKSNKQNSFVSRLKETKNKQFDLALI